MKMDMDDQYVFQAAGNITVHGIDPEVFAVQRKTGAPLAAHQVGLPSMDKRVKSTKGGWPYSLYRDGWAAEINTQQACTCRAWVGNCVRNALYDLAERFGEHDAVISLAPAMKIPLDVVRDGPADIRQVGCRPTANAYTGTIGTPDNFDPVKVPWRVTGCHLHTSLHHYQHSKDSPYPGFADNWWDDFDNMCLYVKMADAYLAAPLTYLLGSELEGIRRQYYGKAGEFRLKDYGREYLGGIEYRVPSSSTLIDHALVNMGFAVLRRLFAFFPEFAKLYDNKIGEQLRAAVNEGRYREDLLDIIPDCAGVHTRDMLRYLRKHYYSQFDVNNLLLVDPRASDAWKNECHSGWSEHVKRVTKGKFKASYNM